VKRKAKIVTRKPHIMRVLRAAYLGHIARTDAQRMIVSSAAGIARTPPRMKDGMTVAGI